MALKICLMLRPFLLNIMLNKALTKQMRGVESIRAR